MSLLLIEPSPPGADLDFNGPMLGMPYSLSRLGFTYTRNSPKTVYQNGALVTLSANQFGTTYDAVTGLYAYEAEPAATNLAINSILAGGGAAPTSWAQGFATGTSTPVASIYGAASGAIAYLQTATAQRPFFAQTISVAANTTYQFTALIESVTGSVTASDVMVFAAPPSGATTTFPVCSANPSGGSTGALTTGELRVQIAVSATAGTVSARIGLGCNANITGTLKFSRPQFETGVRRTSWIATTTGTVTRAADVLSCAVANIPGFSAAGYTLVMDGRVDVVPTGNQFSVSISDTTTANRASLFRTSTTSANIVVSGAAAQAGQSIATTSVARGKSATSLMLNQGFFSREGVDAAADTVLTMPVSPTTFYIGCQNGTGQFNGYIYRVRLIPTALNQAQTTGLTA